MKPKSLAHHAVLLNVHRLRVKVTTPIVNLAVRNLLTRELELVERRNVRADIVSARLVHTGRAPLEVNVLRGDVFAFAAASDGTDGVVSDC